MEPIRVLVENGTESSSWWVTNGVLVAACITAAVTFIAKVVELFVLRTNKKKEIDYMNEVEIKQEIRNHATMIIGCVNEIAVGINTYTDLLDKTIQLVDGKANLTKDNKKTKQELDSRRTEKINQINENSVKLITHLTKFQLYFMDSKYEYGVILNAIELQQITVDLKLAFFEAQENFNSETFEEAQNRLYELTADLNRCIPEFSMSTRKALRTFRYRLHGKVRLEDLSNRITEVLIRVFNKRDKKFWENYWQVYWKKYWILYWKDYLKELYESVK